MAGSNVPSSAFLSRRSFLKAGGVAGATALAFPTLRGVAWGQKVAGDSVEARAVAAGKDLAKGRSIDLTMMVWSAFGRGQTTKLAAEYKKLTGIGIGNAIDVNVFVMPPRAMQEAVAKTGKIDIFHIDLTMVPSLANAGLAMPLDKLMQRGGHAMETVGPAAQMLRYRNEQYGLLTDGNVHVTMLRKDVVDKRRKEYEDKLGKPWSWPQTWAEYNAMMRFFNNPAESFFGSGNLRARRAGGPYWWMMIFYSKGGFPFTDDAAPNINTDIGVAATEEYLATRAFSPPEITDWGSPQMIPYFTKGHIFSVTYWDGSVQVAERPGSPTKGKWMFGQVPGSMQGNTLVKRSITAGPIGYVINRHSKQAEAAYWLCQYLTGPKNSTLVVGDPENGFHDPWHPSHFTNETIINGYTPAGIKAIKENLQITTPALLLTGGPLQFHDLLDKNLAEAMLGNLTAKDAMKKTSDEWEVEVRKIGAAALKRDLPTYKAGFPKINVPVPA